MTSNLKTYSNIKITEYSADGDYINSQTFPNLIVSTGLDFMRDHIIGMTTQRIYQYILGTGTTAAASTDVGVQSSAYTLPLSTYTSTSATVTFTATVGTTIGWGSTYNEIGIFTSSSQLIGRSLLSVPIIKTSSSLTLNRIDWTFSFSEAT